MANRGKKLKLTILIDSEDMEALDRSAEEMSRKDPFGRNIKRSDVARMWLKMGKELAEKNRG